MRLGVEPLTCPRAWTESVRGGVNENKLVSHQRDSNPRLGLEGASPWVVISLTSTPGATAGCHSAGPSAARPRASKIGRSTGAHLGRETTGFSVRGARSVKNGQDLRGSEEFPSAPSELTSKFDFIGLCGVGLVVGGPSPGQSAEAPPRRPDGLKS